MPVPTPFHPRTQALCHSHRWKDWAGHLAVCAYGPCHEAEYHALRQSAGLVDVSPLFKYEITGPDAASYLSWVLARGVEKLKVGRVLYCCWTDDRGHLLDDGTLTHRAPGCYRLTASEASLHWLARHARGFEVELRDVTLELAALAIQGPLSRDVLRELVGPQIDALRFFGHTRGDLGGVPAEITRTGYAGDLGFELWVDRGRALDLWDKLMEAGQRKYHLRPVGLDALDLARLEAGFIMAGVDYKPGLAVANRRQASTPYEAGLGWTVKLDREPFIGQRALRREAEQGSQWATVGLILDEEALAQAYAAFDLPVHLPTQVYRGAMPLYEGSRQVGYTTSSAWSPLLKQYLALATVPASLDQPGAVVEVELDVEFWRRRVPATVTELPFFNPARKRS
jgi:aminomethyltransferase